MRIALAQINVTVGALQENVRRMAEFTAQARRAGADIVSFPELCLTGYPPEDLLFNPAFVQDTLGAARRFARSTRGLTVVAGFVDRDAQGNLFNAAAVYRDGAWVGRYRKMALPNYGVFDEKRYFTSGEKPLILEFRRSSVVRSTRQLVNSSTRQPVRVGISICEDIWVEDSPCCREAAGGAGILLNLSASPYHAGKLGQRERLLRRKAKAYGAWICYVNLVGGQDELVFDGASLLVSPQGRVVFRAPQFKEGLFVVEAPSLPNPLTLPSPPQGVWGPLPQPPRIKVRGVQVVRLSDRPSRRRSVAVSRTTRPLPPDQEIFQALVLGLQDYVRKNGFSRVVLGLSGGIDSALTAAIAVAALGEKAVTGVSMPSRYSSSGTRRDARRLAGALGIRFLEIPIEPVFRSALASLAGAMGNARADITEENLQARIRGLFLMALSNKFGWLVLATGNKSELSTGYCTLYGDMVGGFAVIKDVPKTWVYRLARAANRRFGRGVIPGSVFRREPTAELKLHQRDQDTLPPYGVLDFVVRAYVEERRPAAEIRRRLRRSSGWVSRVLRMIARNEYKRRQAPVGIKITPLAFGKDRRMPITNRYQEVG